MVMCLPEDKIIAVQNILNMFTCRRAEDVAHPLVHAGLDVLLEELRRGGGGEVGVHDDMVVRLVVLEERVDECRLGRALLSDKKQVPVKGHRFPFTQKCRALLNNAFWFLFWFCDQLYEMATSDQEEDCYNKKRC